MADAKDNLEGKLRTMINDNKDSIKEISIRGKHVEKRQGGTEWRLNVDIVRK